VQASSSGNYIAKEAFQNSFVQQSRYQLETTALISKDNYNAFRIRCIMLILENL